jgi:PAS domain S-box-containing protein
LPTPDSQLFRDIFGASPIGIAVENLDGQPHFVNPSFCSFLGFSEDELFTKHFWISLAMKTLSRIGRFSSNYEKVQSITTNLRSVTSDATALWSGAT